MTVSLADPVLATKYALEQSPEVLQALGGRSGRIHGVKIPKGNIETMPEQRIVVKPAGGSGFGVGENDTIGVSVRRVDVWCYGRTPLESAQVEKAVSYALKRFRAGAVRKHFVHWFKYSSGPQTFDDPEFDWPTNVVTFQIQIADELTA